MKLVSPEDYKSINQLEVEHSIKRNIAEALNLRNTGLSYILIVDDIIEGYVLLLRTINYWNFYIYEIILSDKVSIQDSVIFMDKVVSSSKGLGCLELRHYVDRNNSSIVSCLEASGFKQIDGGFGELLYVKHNPVL